jgi:hypothetical protein
MLFPPLVDGVGDFSDLQRHFQAGVTLLAVNTIVARWQEHPPCRWDMGVGDQLSLGEARLTVLSPEPEISSAARAAWQSKGRFDWNTTASALLLEWADLRIVLGSDLVEKPGHGWSKALARTKGLNAHSVLKIPHHGSEKAQDRGLLRRARGSKQPEWIATPFSCANLPRFGRSESGTRLLGHVTELMLTGLPRAYGSQSGAPITVKGSKLAKLARGAQFDPPVPGFPDCYVMLDISPAGKVIRHMGPGSVLVHA